MNMHRPGLFPSLMAADLLNLEKVIKNLEPHCDGFHIDIMDNHFVPNLTWGQDLTNQIARIATKPLLVHLMIDAPEDMVKKLDLTPNSVISFHLEAVESPQIAISAILKKRYIPSIAIKPHTPVEALIPWLEEGVPHVLLMSVEPGFSGQEFIVSSVDRLKELVALQKKSRKEFVICMDGGINKDVIGSLFKEGATQFAVATAVFGQKDPLAALKELYKNAQNN